MKTAMVEVFGSGQAGFERLVELVGTEEDDRVQARQRYRHYKDRGYPLETHEAGA